ncbi:MAG: hypothetical protein P8R37_11615 [Opitutae bacterium]|nr:hypothetical protein [Opitutae bacterium]
MTTNSITPLRHKFNRPLLNRVLENLGDGLNTHPAIEKEGISVRHFYREIKKHPELATEFKQAQLERDQIRNMVRIEEAEAELYRRAVHGWEQETFDENGHLKGSRRRYSDQCLLFMLRKLKRDTFGESPTVLQNEINIIPQRTEKEVIAEWRRELGCPDSTISNPNPQQV